MNGHGWWLVAASVIVAVALHVAGLRGWAEGGAIVGVVAFAAIGLWRQ